MIKGFITMRACPFHKGHEALIEYAKANCDYLTILVGALPSDPIPYKYRLKWVLSTYLDDPQVEVFGDILNEPEYKDDDERSRWNAKYVLERYGMFSRVFTSEDYGKVFAEAMGAENWVFDKSRSIMPISGTAIRNKPLSNWNYLNNFAKDYFVKKIGIVGTESTGKTVMCKRLAEDFSTVWVPEAGRDIIANSNDFTYEDLQLVASAHAKRIIQQSRLANKVMFVDTNLAMTKSYAKHFFGKVPDFAPWIEKANECDMYVNLCADAPYVDDGTRLPKKERDVLAVEHEKMFKEEGMEYVTFCWGGSGMDSYESRYNKVVDWVSNFISKF